LISAEGRSTVQYPGGIAARYRWGGTGEHQSVFSVSESGGRLEDHGSLVATEPDRLCRAELRVEGPVGSWTARFASPIFDEPRGVTWDVPGLLVVVYGFVAYALEARTGELRWTHRSGSPLVSVLGTPRLPHVLLQSEVETVALAEDGGVVWRVTHSDVVTEAALVGGRLVLGSYGGQHQTLDPLTGRPAD